MPGNQTDSQRQPVVPEGCAYMLNDEQKDYFKIHLKNRSFTPHDANKPPGQSPLRDMYINNDVPNTALHYVQFVKQMYDDGVLGWNKTHVQNALILLKNADKELYNLYIIILTDESFLPPSGVSWIVQRV